MSVTVYTANHCQPCRATKRHLAKLGIEFTEINVSDDREARDFLIAMGFAETPVVMTDERSWSGYQPTKLDQLR